MPDPSEREANEVLSVESMLTSRGQTTIPLPIRRALGLRASDKVRFSLRGDDTVVISRVSAEQRDPMVAAFLGFIEADTHQHPQRVRAIPADVVDRARRLSAGVEVDLEHDVRTNAAKRLAAVTKLAAGNPPDTWDRLMSHATANTHRLRCAVPPDDPDV